MATYLVKARSPTWAEFAEWQRLGYTGAYENYSAIALKFAGTAIVVNGDLGKHCTQCAAPSDILCDYPVGEGMTCDRPLCCDHAKEVAPDVHFCDGHYAAWRNFLDAGGVDAALRNVIAFKTEK